MEELTEGRVGVGLPGVLMDALGFGVAVAAELARLA